MLLFREAVCRNPDYSLGRRIRRTHADNPAIPEGFWVGYTLQPTDCKRKRGHLQVYSRELDFVLRVLNRASPPSEGFLPEYEKEGNNFVRTPCTCAASLAHAMENRQRLKHADRPWVIAPRHKTGYDKAQRELTQRLWQIINTRGRTPLSLAAKAATYSGTKRVHYEKCALETEAHPLTMRERHRIFHDGSVKWGELSDRPRALMVQSVRARGTKGVKEGEILRSPILVEGVYRDLEEDALHHFCHASGHHYTASGMSLHKRARAIEKMMRPGDVILSCDWSSFDGSLGHIGISERNEFLRAAEKRFGRNEQLRAVIATQNQATVQAGPLRAQVLGNRGSGTAGTSTGNKKVVLAALFYALGPAAKGADSVKFFCDGDDTLLFVPKKYQDERWVASWVRRMTELGLETKVEQYLVDTPHASATERVRFCRAGVVDTSRGKFLCKVPQDAIKVVTNFRRHFRGPYFQDYCATLATGLHMTYGDVPILCKLSQLMPTAGKVDKGLLESSGIEYMMGKTTDHVIGAITDSHRLSFYRTWGITPTMQKQCELALQELGNKLRPLLATTRL